MTGTEDKIETETVAGSVQSEPSKSNSGISEADKRQWAKREDGHWMLIVAIVIGVTALLAAFLF